MLIAAKALDREALACLCQVYWAPVYEFVRAHGNVSHDLALDVTQSVFDGLLRRDLRTLDVERGSRFRHWLKRVARSELLLAWRKAGRISRVEVLASHGAGESPEAAPDASDATPQDRLFDRQTARVLVGRAWERLRLEKYADRAVLFDHLKQSLLAEETVMTDAELCAHLGYRDSYVRSLRKRVKDDEFPRALRAELRAIGVPARRMNEELRALADALSD